MTPEQLTDLIKKEAGTRYAVTCKLEAAQKEYEAAIVEDNEDRANSARLKAHVLLDMLMDSSGTVAMGVRKVSRG